jgi:hypothetical protein
MRSSDPMSAVQSLLPARPAGDCVAMRGLAVALRERADNLDIVGAKIATATPEDMWKCPQADGFYERMEDLQHTAHKSLPNQLRKLADELDRESTCVANAQSDWDRSLHHAQDLARDAARRGEDVVDAVRRGLPRLLI